MASLLAAAAVLFDVDDAVVVAVVGGVGKADARPWLGCRNTCDNIITTYLWYGTIVIWGSVVVGRRAPVTSTGLATDRRMG
jgi:hypothetical protein